MALTQVALSTPEYNALSTDIVDNSISGLTTPGAKVFLTDITVWKVVKSDATLADWVANVGNLFSNATFHEEATSTGNGTSFEVNNYKTLTVEIFGTSTSRTITFYGKSKSETLRSIMGVNVASFATATSTTGTAEIWQFDISGLDYVIMDLTAVSGGNVSVKGRVIA